MSKLEAARLLEVSPSTIDRRIKRGELGVERDRVGRHKVWVMLPDEVAQDVEGESSDAELAAARQRIRDLEELAEFHAEQLRLADQRYQDVSRNLTASLETTDRLTRMLPPPKADRPWWRRWFDRSI